MCSDGATPPTVQNTKLDLNSFLQVANHKSKVVAHATARFNFSETTTNTPGWYRVRLRVEHNRGTELIFPAIYIAIGRAMDEFMIGQSEPVTTAEVVQLLTFITILPAQPDCSDALINQEDKCKIYSRHLFFKS